MSEEIEKNNSSDSKNEQKEECCKTTPGKTTCGCGGGFSATRLFMFLIVVLAAIYAFRVSQPVELPSGWSSDLATSQQLASGEGKDVLIAFHTSWCVYCTNMKEEVYVKSKFQDYAAKNLILVMLDGDREKELVNKYNIQGFPSYVVLRADGQVRSVFAGYHPVDDFIAELSKSISK